MRKLGILLIILVAMPVTSQAANNHKGYWGLMVGGLDYTNSTISISTTAGTFRAGYEFIPYLAIEGRALTSTTGDSAPVTSFQVDYVVSAFAKVNIPLNKAHSFRIYGLVGYSSMKYTYEQTGLTGSVTDNGLSFGGGFDFFADDLNGLNIEWTRFLDKEKSGIDYDLTQLSIGYIRRF